MGILYTSNGSGMQINFDCEFNAFLWFTKTLTNI